MNAKTYTLRESEIDRRWYLVDATGQTLGRLATRVARVLEGKDKPTYTPNLDSGDHVIILNAALISVTRDKLETNTRRFRAGVTAAGLAIREGTHPITPVMLGDARLAAEMAQKLLGHGIYVIGFSYPVVPKG